MLNIKKRIFPINFLNEKIKYFYYKQFNIKYSSILIINNNYYISSIKNNIENIIRNKLYNTIFIYLFSELFY